MIELIFLLTICPKTSVGVKMGINVDSVKTNVIATFLSYFVGMKANNWKMTYSC